MGSCSDGFAFKCKRAESDSYHSWQLMSKEEACPDGIILPDDIGMDYSNYELYLELDRLIISTYKQWLDVYYGQGFKQHQLFSADYSNVIDTVRFNYLKVYNQELFIICEDGIREIIRYPITNFCLVKTSEFEYMLTQGYVMGYAFGDETQLSPIQAFDTAFELRSKLPEFFSKKRKKISKDRPIKRSFKR